MASVLRVDQLQTSNGVPLLSSSNNGVLTVDSRLQVPQYTTDTLPQSAVVGEIVFDIEALVLKYWNGEDWINIGSPKAKSKVLGMNWVTWNQQTALSSTQTYTAAAGSELSFSTRSANSKFLIWTDMPGYDGGVAANGGLNNAYIWNGSLIGGIGAQEAWMQVNHSATGGSFNLKKIMTYQPNLPAGSSVTLQTCFASWSGTASSCVINYSGYSPISCTTIMEVE